MLAVIRFRTGGSLRFLSHAETLRLFQRACVRAGVKVAYSQGFNPHQRMSLVLPRSVGVESDDEMLCLRLAEGQTTINDEALKNALPAGIEILSVKISEAKKTPEPVSARYLMKVRRNDAVRQLACDILASDKIIANRRTSEASKTKPVDIRPFVESIEVEQEQVAVDCRISNAGTIRVDEILDLLHLKTTDLTGPVRRTNVKYIDTM